MKGKLHIISFLVVLGVVIFGSCAKPQPETVVEPEIPVIVPEGPVNIRNPVEVYCTGLGYEFTTRERKIEGQQTQIEVPTEFTNESPEGPQPGIPVVPDYILEVVCAFPDGNECEEEEFRLGRCGQEYSYCVQQGYRLEPGSTLEPGVNSATCVFPDGSSCPELAFFNGDCGPAISQYTEVPKATSTEVSEEALDTWLARDAALAYVIEHYNERAPAPGLTWTEERTDLVGWVEYHFAAEDWVITIEHAVLPPERIVYQIVVTHEITEFEWKGEVDATGKVTETLAPTDG